MHHIKNITLLPCVENMILHNSGRTPKPSAPTRCAWFGCPQGMGGARGHFRRAPWSGNFLGKSRFKRPSWRATRGLRMNGIVEGKKILRSAIGVILVVAIDIA
jgi:hypothetical protein